MTDVLDEGMLGVSADMLSDMEIIAVTTPPITLEFVLRISYAVDVVADVVTVVIKDAVPAIDADMLTDMSVDGLTAVMAPLLEFTLSAS